MPPRLVTAAIIAGWLASIGWFIYREWAPWFRTDSPPPFTVELADEASPLVANWSIWRSDRKIGSLTTRLTVQKDDTFELYSSIENLEIAVAGLTFKVPKLTTIQKVTREGELRSVKSQVQLALSVLGESLEMKGSVDGVVRDGKLQAACRIDSPLFGALEQEVEPIPMVAASVFNPMQPLAKLQVRPGQHWKIANFDPLAEALKSALTQLAARYRVPINAGAALKTEAAKAYLAEVLTEPRDLTQHDESHSSYVIEYRSEGITGRTWVRASDGKVLRQEVTNGGERMILIREN